MFLFYYNFFHDSQLFRFAIYNSCAVFTFLFQCRNYLFISFYIGTDLLRDSINESFLRVNIMLSASPALHQATLIIAVITQNNARLLSV